jgi:quercetin dioxygenase-like cupin family protein
VPGGIEEVRAFLVEIPPGRQTGWHRHSAACYRDLLSGRIVVESENAAPVTLRGGARNGRNDGHEPVRIVLFVPAVADQTVTTPVDHPPLIPPPQSG